MIYSKKIMFIILALVIFAAIYFIFIHQPAENGDNKNTGENSQLENNTGNSSRTSVRVTVEKVKRGDLVKRITAFGIADATRILKILPDTQGRVKSITVKNGDLVKKDQILFKLDDTEALLALERAQDTRIQNYSRFLIQEMDYRDDTDDSDKRITEVKKKYLQIKKRHDEGLISEKEFKNAERVYRMTLEAAKLDRETVVKSQTGLTDAELAVKSAELTLKKTVSRAPFSGIITDLNLVLGKSVSSADEVMTLVDYSTIRITAEVMESEIPALEKGRNVKIDFIAIPGKIYNGTINHISPIIDEEKKTGKVEILIDNPDLLIKPGMNARVRLDSLIFENRLLVPRAAVLERDGRKLVFIVKDGRAKWEYIHSGLENEEYVEIIPDSTVGIFGVHENDIVITDGHQSLSHDTEVAYKEPD
ncbi:MAG: efflux RND transporter periplasmic adaptor subunit [Acidobacteria bacterium]|nr:efflux RND transporter periplasmic adaptor subunit [Acidobacteriota bacterium]